MNLSLTADEVSALIEACNVARGHGSRPRPPWDADGESARLKLLEAEKRAFPSHTWRVRWERPDGFCSFADFKFKRALSEDEVRSYMLHKYPDRMVNELYVPDRSLCSAS